MLSPNKVIFASIGSIGLVFFAFSFMAFKKLDDSTDKAVLNSWATIQTLSICMVVASITYFACQMSGKDGTCKLGSNKPSVYYSIFGILALAMTIPSIFILKGGGEDKAYAGGVLGISLIVLILCIILIMRQPKQLPSSS